MVLQLAEKYGRPPEEVENWDVYWFERAAVLLEGESIDSERRKKDLEKQARRRK